MKKPGTKIGLSVAITMTVVSVSAALYTSNLEKNAVAASKIYTDESITKSEEKDTIRWEVIQKQFGEIKEQTSLILERLP